MRAAFLLVLVTVGSSNASSEPMAWKHLHAMSAPAAGFVQLATERSAVVRSLLDQIERTDVIVLFRLSSEPVAPGRRNFMTFVSAAAGTRYVAIELYSRSLPPFAHIPLLAHELQHVLEVAAAPEVRDDQACARLFATIGWPTGPGRFETQAARVIERRVRQELSGNRAH